MVKTVFATHLYRAKLDPVELEFSCYRIVEAYEAGQERRNTNCAPLKHALTDTAPQ